MSKASERELGDLYPGLRSLVSRYAAATEVDDWTQECCVRIVAKQGRYRRAEGPFRAWAARVARNVSISLSRRRRREAELASEPAAVEREYAADEVGWVLEQVARLPHASREVLRLRYYEDLSVTQVAERLAISQPAASKRLAKALDLLRARAGHQGLFSLLLPPLWAASLAASPKMKLSLCAVIVALLGCAAGSFFLPAADTPVVSVTSELPHTEFLDTLAAPLDAGRNQLWCATLPLAWRELGALFGERLELQGAPASAARLSASPARRADVDERYLVAGAGWVRDGVVDDLQEELERVFGEGRDPILDEHSGAEALQALAYAFLFSELSFAVPFEDLAELPLEFRYAEGGGRRSARVDAFGIEELIEPASMAHHRALRRQVRVYDYRSGEDFIVRLLAQDSQDWLLLARVAPGPSLQATSDAVWKRVRASEPEQLEPGDSLLVPELDFHLTHHFAELAGKHFLNPDHTDEYLLDCVQDLRLRLDERGMVMKSRAVIPVGAESDHYPKRLHYTAPYLLLCQRNGAPRPYLAAWIAHPEILVAAPETGEPVTSDAADGR